MPQDYAQALKWWRMAANQGEALAQNGVGWIYLKCGREMRLSPSSRVVPEIGGTGMRDCTNQSGLSLRKRERRASRLSGSPEMVPACNGTRQCTGKKSHDLAGGDHDAKKSYAKASRGSRYG